jgi:ABC-type transport system involved in cytochrome c biogenesis permease subunit
VNDSLKQILKPLASLRLTVVLLAMAMILIFAGTWAQIDSDIVVVKHTYFHAWFCWIPFGIFWWRAPSGGLSVPGGIPFVGGYTLIGALLANLLAAHSVRFKLTWKRSGIILIHLGLIMLLLSEILTANFAKEGTMRLTTNMALNYVQDIQHSELAVVDTSPADHDNVTVVPASLIEQPGTTVHDGRLPFDIHVDDYYQNSQLLGPMQDGAKADPRVNAGTEVGRRIVPAPSFAGVGADADKVNLPAAVVTLSHGGFPLGTWMVSAWADAPQDVTLPDGKSYTIDLRFVRTYKPYTVKLLKFTHEKYVGSDIDKNFASRVRLVDPSRHVDLEALIWMNHPLRYDSQTFYQQSFDPNRADATTIQIVKNYNWILPYVALGIAIVGLLTHFGILLTRFLGKQLDSFPNTVSPLHGLTAAIAIGAPVICALIYLATSLPHDNPDKSTFDLNAFGQLPISYDGRTMPLDTLARTSLKIIHGREALDDANGHRVAPIEWLIDLMSNSDKSNAYPLFLIDNPDVLNTTGLDPAVKYFSSDDLLKHEKTVLPELQRVMKRANDEGGTTQFDATDRKLYELAQHLVLQRNLADLSQLYLVPPINGRSQWQKVEDTLVEVQKTGKAPESLRSFMDILKLYTQKSPVEFNSAVAAYHSSLETALPSQHKTDSEAYFNRFDPFTICMVLYVGVLLLAMTSWLVWQKPLSTAAMSLMAATFVLHTTALIWRMVLSGRPPVTNLYSSAIFIAWVGLLLCVVLEMLYRNGVGSVVGAAIGFSSLLIANALAVEGDTMEQLRAVLDTNYWLATHVVCITIGYATTFVAGLLAIVYILRGVFTTQLDADLRKTIARMIYGIVCCALLFSFVGTILGGIWADQSWGRFWGWDPKENGAILIVLWNAIILHARWCGLVRDRGMAVLAVFGNIVTSWSWFGTNMLGVGLHSYGFTDNARFLWLVGFVLSQLFIVLLGWFLPTSLWGSYSAEGPPPLSAARPKAAARPEPTPV